MSKRNETKRSKGKPYREGGESKEKRGSAHKKTRLKGSGVQQEVQIAVISRGSKGVCFFFFF